MKSKISVVDKVKGMLAQNWVAIVIMLALVAAPLYLSDFRLNLLGKFLAFAILALSLDLIWGHAGILSLGHGLFFGLGAYCFAMYLKLEASGGMLPDFMSWSGLSSLPWFWKPFANPAYAIVMAIMAPLTLAAIMGYLTFRNRIKGVYFSILTQALALIFVILFVGQQQYTGGTNGITDLKAVFGMPIAEPTTHIVLYFAALTGLAVSYFVCLRLTRGKLGRILVAIRDGENRLRFSGYNPVPFKVFVFAVSAGLAGLSGVLFVPQVGIISPAMMGIVPSIEVAIWVAIGGRGTLVGAVIGALLVNFAKSGLSETYPDIWSLLIGALFVGVVLLFPDGIVGIFRKLPRIMKKNAPSSELPDTVEATSYGNPTMNNQLDAAADTGQRLTVERV